MGSEAAIADFFRANDWLSSPRTYERSSRYLGSIRSLPKRFLERILAGRFGDKIEAILRKDQIKRIESGLPHSLGYKPRFIYNDDELEFHPDTRRIEKILKRLEG